MENNDVPINPDVPVKKKRGRKPKSYYENLNKEEKVEQPKTEVVHKKRGRKPKGGKILEQKISNVSITSKPENIILHLLCKISDLNSKEINILPYNQSNKYSNYKENKKNNLEKSAIPNINSEDNSVNEKLKNSNNMAEIGY